MIVVGPMLLIAVLVIALNMRGASKRRANRNAQMIAQATRRVELELMRANDPARYAAAVANRDLKRLVGWIAIGAFAVLMVVVMIVSAVVR